jgi:hypothetical protein
LSNGLDALFDVTNPRARVAPTLGSSSNDENDRPMLGAWDSLDLHATGAPYRVRATSRVTSNDPRRVAARLADRAGAGAQ